MLADNLRAGLRGIDTAARYGGEEFAVILPQTGEDGALIVAERLRARIEQMDIPEVGGITISLGVATFPAHASSRRSLVVTADRALYLAKHAGRNRVCTASESGALPDSNTFISNDIVSDDADTEMAHLFPLA